MVSLSAITLYILHSHPQGVARRLTYKTVPCDIYIPFPDYIIQLKISSTKEWGEGDIQFRVPQAGFHMLVFAQSHWLNMNIWFDSWKGWGRLNEDEHTWHQDTCDYHGQKVHSSGSAGPGLGWSGASAVAGIQLGSRKHWDLGEFPVSSCWQGSREGVSSELGSPWAWIIIYCGAGRWNGGGDWAKLTPAGITQSLYLSGFLGETSGKRVVGNAMIRRLSFIIAV